MLLNLLDDMFFAAIPAVGFAILFNVPRNALKYCAYLGALGHGSRTLMMQFGLSQGLATLCAASLVGFIGVYLSQRYRAHPKVFTVAAIIPMIPGVYVYKAMIALVQINHKGFSEQLLGQVVDYFVKSGFVIGALAFGLALPGLLFYRQRPVV